MIVNLDLFGVEVNGQVKLVRGSVSDAHRSGKLIPRQRRVHSTYALGQYGNGLPAGN